MSANLLHFGINFLLSFALSFMMPQDVTVGFTVGLSVGKEVGDYMNYGQEVGYQEFAKMACNDLIIDGLGITAGQVTYKLVGDFLGESDEESNNSK